MTGDPREEDGKRTIHCPGCGKRYRIDDRKVPPGVNSFACRGCGKPVPLSARVFGEVQPENGAPRILLALNEPELTALVMRILHRGGMEGIIAHTGEQAERMLRERPFAVFFLSVVLPDMMGYELIEKARSQPRGSGLPILLLASLFRTTRYKRAPTSLYGADDYIEMHHLPDFLVPKLKTFIQGGRVSPLQRPGPGSLVLPSSEEQEECRQIERIAPETPHGEMDDPSAAVRRMARIIVADIALYNEEAIRGRPLAEALGTLQKDIDEGVRLMEARFSGLGGEEAARHLGEEMANFLSGHAGTGRTDPPGGERG